MSKIKAITLQYELIEMSQTRARGACTQMDLKNTLILMETKLHLIAHVSVYERKDKLENIRLYPFYYSSISTLSLRKTRQTSLHDFRTVCRIV